jgi:hypothetical protein
MKRILFTLLLLVAFMAGYSQLTNNGGIITIENGASVVIEGSYTSTSAGVIEIDGTVTLKGDFINNGGSIATGSTGLLAFNGTAAQAIEGSQSTTFYCAVEVNNAAGVELTAAASNDQVVDSSLTLTSGKVTLNEYDLTLSNEGVLGAVGTSNYIVTNSTGELKAPVTNADYVFPVGDATTYNPVTLNEGTTPDTYGVIFTGTSLIGATHSVLGNWAITEGTAGCNLTVTPQWNGTQEQASFDRLDCAVGVTTDNGATVAWKASGAAVGGDPYTRSGAGFAGVGKFLVGDYFFEGFEVDLDFFLAGPYNTGTGLMNVGLKTKNLIPLNDPYGLGNVVTSIPANVVDWVKVELRDKTNPATILFTRAFFLDNSGNVLYKDGTSGAKFTGVPKDQYYIAIKHRNHLGVRTAATVDLTAASPAFNFKSNTGVFQNQTYAPQALVGGGNYGLYKGNVNGDARVAKTGTPALNDYTALLTYLGANTSILNVYAGADINMDGDVRKTGTPAQNDYTALLNSLGSATSILQQIP